MYHLHDLGLVWIDLFLSSCETAYANKYIFYVLLIYYKLFQVVCEKIVCKKQFLLVKTYQLS
jgi:hypothetical protein